MKDAQLLVATPIDYLFLLLPCLTKSPSAKSSSKGLFLSLDDLLENLSEKSKHLDQLLGHPKLRQAMEERMEVVCDTVDAGDEKMYRLSDEKLLNELLLKAKAIVARGLPASMEERFIGKVLETPVMVVKREESSLLDANLPQNDTPTSESVNSESVDSQTSITSVDSIASAATEITIPDETAPSAAPNELYHLLRLRTALSYTISSYVPPILATTLNSMLASENSPMDFKSLDEYLARIAKLRAEALAARSLGDFSRKRSMFEEDDAAETRAEKKRKKEEEEKKKKAGETRGIRDLKKVDTKGMKKMSDFFGRRTSPRKK
ncbi:ribonuclease H2 subunit B, partial [Lecanoromycetidae sp. Uapishka_2]